MDKFSINSYMSLMNTDGKWWVIGDSKMYELINFLINIGMVLNRWIYQLVDLSLQIFMNNTVFEDTISSVFSVAINLYGALFSSLGTTLFIFAVASIFLVFTFSSPQEAFRKIIVLFMVIGVNFVVYSKGEEYLKDVNGIFEEVETVMTSAMTLPMFDSDGNKTVINAANESSVDVIRETYFKLTMEQSFAMVNFGTPEYKKEFNEFLYTVEQETDTDSIDELARRVKEASEENRYLTPDGSLDKIFISIYAVVSNIFVGAPLLVIAAMKFLLKILILVMVFGLPILSLLSLIPKFSNSIFNGIGKMIMVFSISLFLTVGMFLFFFVMTLIDSSVIAMAGTAGGATLVSCVLAAIVKGLTVYLIVKFRNQIVSFVTGGRVTNINAMDKRLLRAMKKSGGRSNENVSVSTDSADTLAINQAAIDIANAIIHGDLLDKTNDDVIDSRDYVDSENEFDKADIEIDKAEIEADDLTDDEYTKTNEDRADIEKKEIDDENNELDYSEIDGEGNNFESEDDSVVAFPNDEMLNIEELDPLEAELDKFDSVEVLPTDEVVNMEELESVGVETDESDSVEVLPTDEMMNIEEPESVEVQTETFDSVESSSVDVDTSKSVEVEKPEPVEVDNLDSVKVSESSGNESGVLGSIQLNNQVNNELNDFNTLEEPPVTQYEEFYETLEMLRNE